MCCAASTPIKIQYGVITLMSVFSDILPDYRIRKLTEQEESVTVSKDVQSLRALEVGGGGVI